MIFDRIENWRRYFGQGGTVGRAFEFLNGLSADAEEREYDIDGNKCFARVMSYMTRAADAPDAVIECHRKYADIQMTLTGGEGIHWFSREGLTIKTAYDAERDVEFFHNPGVSAAPVVNYPGTFCILYPEDVHRPQMAVHDIPSRVKKVVVKVLL
jgi:YhcH/YjgK/YiaL family protein